MFEKSDGTTYVESTTYCDGTSLPVYSTRSCDVPMTTIISLTGRSVDSLIEVKVRAINANGNGPYSETNPSGATIETTPSKMDAPTFDLSQTTTTSAFLNWVAPTGTAKGGSSITISSYEV